jgi:hypothetical protein
MKKRKPNKRATVRGSGQTFGGRYGGLRETKEEEEREGWAVPKTHPYRNCEDIGAEQTVRRGTRMQE